MLTPQEEKLLDALIWTRDNTNPHHGICERVMDYLKELPPGGRIAYEQHWCDVHPVMDRLFCDWPEFSGRATFPIGVLGEFNHHANRGTMWDTTQKYGRARWRLLHWMIAELEGRADD